MSEPLKTMLDEHLDPQTPRQPAVGGRPENPLTKCKCGRVVPMDMMVDVRKIPNIPHDFLCDGCTGRLTMRGRVSVEEIGAAQKKTT